MSKTGKQLKDSLTFDEDELSTDIENVLDGETITPVIDSVRVIMKYTAASGATVFKVVPFTGPAKLDAAGICESLQDLSEAEF